MFLLEVRDMTKHFGGIKAVEEVKFRVQENSILSIIGPNGAGKTTLFNCLTGLIRPTRGNIYFLEQDITRLKANNIVKLGMARTFQNIRLFREMSVLENVMVSHHCRTKTNLIDSILRNRKFIEEDKIVHQKSIEYLELVGLEDVAYTLASNLSYGSQKRLEIARTLATEPRLILLDEPTAGMNPQETSEMMTLIKKLQKLGKTIILIEHDMKVVMGISDNIVVLDHGVKIAEGTPLEIRTNPMVIEAYLGREFNA
ncbi:MAG: ABC transporter ATP-binding protein [Nitrospiraceae bacterium]|nr:ABC transporter ATP-binding protein [Nitrospiraceae bacterium]